jgi:hypothetical protein
MMRRRDFLRGAAGAPLAMGTLFEAARADALATGRAPSIAYDIEHAGKTVPIPGTELFAMPDPGPRTDTRTALMSQGDICVGGAGYLWKSRDRGETWTMTELPCGTAGGFGILDRDVFILLNDAKENLGTSVRRSTDKGSSWSDPVALDIGPYDISGGGWSDVYQHPDGTAMITVTLRRRDGWDRWDDPAIRGFHDFIFRSTDGGKTWGDRTLIVPYSAETSLLALRDSRRMLCFIRAQRGNLPEDSPDLWKQTGCTQGHAYPLKNGVVAESDDGGRTWKNPRLFDTYGSVPGELIQVPDGRLAAVWLQRYPHDKSEIRVRISADGGRTWGKQNFALRQGHGYPSSVVYADGIIVTVCENTRMTRTGQPVEKRTMAASRWRLPT